MSEIYDALRRVQEKREGRTPLENGGPTTNTMLEDMLRQAEAVLHFSEDVQRRMSEVGVDGLGGVLNLYSQLRTALDKVAPSEIEASAADVTHLLETMRRLRDELQRMKALKQTFEALH
jgi:hypothetical protein